MEKARPECVSISTGLERESASAQPYLDNWLRSERSFPFTPADQKKEKSCVSPSLYNTRAFYPALDLYGLAVIYTIQVFSKSWPAALEAAEFSRASYV